VQVAVKLGLRAAIGAGDDAGFFDFRIIERIRDGGFEIKLPDPTPWAITRLKWLRCSCTGVAGVSS